MTDDMKEKLSNSELSQITEKKIHKLIRKMFQKNVQYTSDILDIPIDEDGNTICTEGEQLRFLVLMHGILQHQTARLESAKNNIFAEIKEMDSKVAEDLIGLNDLKLS